MPAQIEAVDNDKYQQGFDALRSKIELLPAGQQAGLRRLVDQADETCGQLRTSCTILKDAVGDLRLATKCAEFDMEATVREIQESRRRSDW